MKSRVGIQIELNCKKKSGHKKGNCEGHNILCPCVSTLVSARWHKTEIVIVSKKKKIYDN